MTRRSLASSRGGGGVDSQECLQAEVAPLALWLDFVKAYLAAGQGSNAECVLREGTSAEVSLQVSACSPS